MTLSTTCAKINIMEVQEKYRIKGKIYYKIFEETINPEDYSLVDGVWHLKNPKGEEFRLLVGKGGRRYTMYPINGRNPICKVKSISKVEK